MEDSILWLLGEVFRFNANAVPTHQTEFNAQKVSFVVGYFEHSLRINIHFIKSFSQLLYKCKVNVTQRVF